MARALQRTAEAVSFDGGGVISARPHDLRVMPQRHEADNDGRDNVLELSIGRQVRELRRRLELTVVELARASNLSAGMLSKIENGITSPSLSTLQSLARALNVPVTVLFRKFEERQEPTYTRAGGGPVVDRRGMRDGLRFRQLGRSGSNEYSVEPLIVEIDSLDGSMPSFQHEGVELMHMLSGRMTFRYGEKTYELNAGDSLFFDGDQPHGPVTYLELPIRILVVGVSPNRG